MGSVVEAGVKLVLLTMGATFVGSTNFRLKIFGEKETVLNMHRLSIIP